MYRIQRFQTRSKEDMQALSCRLRELGHWTLKTHLTDLSDIEDYKEKCIRAIKCEDANASEANSSAATQYSYGFNGPEADSHEQRANEIENQVCLQNESRSIYDMDNNTCVEVDDSEDILMYDDALLCDGYDHNPMFDVLMRIYH